MAFGGTMIDANGPTRDMPIRSMVTGLIANARGYDRSEREKHRDLDQRLVMGARLDRAGVELFDFQTALLFEDESGWTTRGEPEGRAKSPSYSKGSSGRKELNHIRRRYYRADALVTVALRLEPPEGTPKLDEIKGALISPARPLFVGRKPCLPSRPLISEPSIEAESVLAALTLAGLMDTGEARSPRSRQPEKIRLIVPEKEASLSAEFPGVQELRRESIADARDWIAGVHAGESRLVTFAMDRSAFKLADLERMP